MVMILFRDLATEICKYNVVTDSFDSRRYQLAPASENKRGKCEGRKAYGEREGEDLIYKPVILEHLIS